MSVSGGDRYDDRFATLRRKHGTYWRWVRPVFDGPTRSAANARIEFRPIAAQPTVRDSIAFQAAFAGLMESLPRRAHPVEGLDWETAKENFYAAAREGLDADLTWVTNAGDVTTNTGELYDDLLAHAADGLESAGCSAAEAAYYIDPLRRRVETATTPAAWKRSRVRTRLDDGESFEAAVAGMQRSYIERQKQTLLEGCFTDWI
jgi:gamma-glutamyl:cysteine ligase YbdK (ATP-grasp superfamily)